MPLPTIADVYRCVLTWAGPGGTVAHTTFHVLRLTSTPSAVASTIDANVTATMWNHTTVGAAVTRLSVTKLDGVSATYELATTGAKWAGPTAAGDILPAGSAIITLRTGNRGRRYRGRLYLPFVAEANQANGVITGAVVTALQSAWETFRAAMNTASEPLQVASYGFNPGPPPVTWTPFSNNVSSVTAQSIMGTIRLRQSRLR